jgi:hypothetical protein
VQKLVPVSSITKAVRLTYVYYNIGYKMVAMLDQVIHEGSEPWPLEIMDGGIEAVAWPILRSGKVPRITSTFITITENLNKLAPYASTIQFLRLEIYELDGLEPGQPCLPFAQLTSLSILLDSFKLLITYTLPALKYLSFYSQADQVGSW